MAAGAAKIDRLQAGREPCSEFETTSKKETCVLKSRFHEPVSKWLMETYGRNGPLSTVEFEACFTRGHHEHGWDLLDECKNAIQPTIENIQMPVLLLPDFSQVFTFHPIYTSFSQVTYDPVSSENNLEIAGKSMWFGAIDSGITNMKATIQLRESADWIAHKGGCVYTKLSTEQAKLIAFRDKWPETCSCQHVRDSMFDPEDFTMAFATGLHKRLGANSRVLKLDAGVVCMIARYYEDIQGRCCGLYSAADAVRANIIQMNLRYAFDMIYDEAQEEDSNSDNEMQEDSNDDNDMEED